MQCTQIWKKDNENSGKSLAAYLFEQPEQRGQGSVQEHASPSEPQIAAQQGCL